MRRLIVPAAVLLIGTASTAVAQTAAVIRDEPGTSIRATRVGEALRIDGRLDEPIYGQVPAVSGFVQQLPREGPPATEPTDIWIFFDNDRVYVAAYCHESEPERSVANELRRDNRNVFSLNDNFSVVFDTFFDRRNGYFFQTNPIGAVRDQAIKDGGQNESWNTVWEVKTQRVADGYTVEMAIPFKSLRYRNAGPQVWGFNARRVVKWKNEVSNLTRVPASYGSAGVSQMNTAATLLGLETPGQAINLEVKPYGVTSVTTDRAAARAFSNDLQPAIGFDAKYGLTRGLTADLTVNTDFAQVEEDQQQINLTRFSLFFPEKRDFFLEGQGIFDFASQTGAGGNVPIVFFSRRVGLSSGQSVPVVAGGRVTGKAGRFDVGALLVRTGDKSQAGAVATDFSAVRLRRDILRRSSIGFIATGRWPALSGADRNAAGGVDADFRFFTNIQLQAYWARTTTPGTSGGADSTRARFNYGGDRYGLEAEHLTVGRNFTPEVGFVRRSAFASSALNGRFSPRLRRGRRIRRLNARGEMEYITDVGRTVVEDKTLFGAFGVEFNSSDQIDVSVTQRYERLPSTFAIATGVRVPRGGYRYDTVNASYTLGQQRPLSGTISGSAGSFYGGTKRTVSYSGRFGFSAHLAAEPTVSVNWVDLPYGDFVARLVGTRLVVAPTARLGISSLVQFNAGAHTLTSSARVRWEYAPGSEIFAVYSDGRDTATAGFPGLVNRTVAVKATRLLRF